jgi:hypothetical protein
MPWATLAVGSPNGQRSTSARAALGLTPEERIAGFVYLGTAVQGAAERVRADVSSRISTF